MYENVIYFFSSPFITQNVCMDWVWESWKRINLHMYRGWLYSFSVKSFCLSSSFSIFASLIQSHLQEPNHLTFSSFLNPGQSGARPEPRVMWYLVAAFCGLLFSAHLCWLYNILDAYTNSYSHTSGLHVVCRHASFYHATHTIYAALPQRNNIHSVYFR